VSGFDPTKYLTKVKGNDYLEVKHRLLWLRSAEPNAVIDTELMAYTPTSAIFRAKQRGDRRLRGLLGEG
jgi:hypothetical protein